MQGFLTTQLSTNAISASYATLASSAITASWAMTSSNAITASWAPATPSLSASFASTANFVNNVIYDFISGSNITTTAVNGTATPLSFSIAPNETWTCEAYISSQCSGTGGVKYAISASNSSSIKFVEGWVIGTTSAITSQTMMRFTSNNILQTTAMHTIATTPSVDRIHFLIMNGSAVNTISIAFASGTAAQTSTIFAGSYLNARRVN